jgi:hypothetical protein
MFATALLALPAALAHVPHDTVVALAPDLDGSRPWYLLLDAHTPMLLRSGDGGASFDSMGGAPLGDAPTDLARLDDGTLVLLGATELWWTSDGASWSHAPVPGDLDLLASEGDDLLLGGGGGLWRMSLDGTTEQEWAEPVLSITSGPRPSAILSSGDLLVGVGGAWTAVAPPESPARSTLGDTDRLWVGTEDGRLVAWDGNDWLSCGALPSAGVEHGDVVAIATDGESVVVSDGFSIVSQSDDACATWTDRALPDSTIYDVEGAAVDEREAAVSLDLVAGKVALAGWPGLYVADAADRWDSPGLMVVDYLRGLALSAEKNGFPLLVTGPQGAGPALTEDGGQTWSSPSHGLPYENVQQVDVDHFDRRYVYAVVNHLGYRSTDAGVTWEKVTASEGKVSVFRAGGTACQVWAGAQGALVRSDDCGEHWVKVSTPEDMPNTFDDVARFADNGADTWCLLTREPAELWCGDAKDGPFTLRWSGGETDIPAMAAWPPDRPSRLIVASGSTFWWSDDAFATSNSLTPNPLDGIAAMAMGDDGTAFAATLGGALYRSADGGETWTDLGLAMTAPVWTMVARQGMATTGDLLLGTLDGLWLMDDPLGEAPTVERFSPWARVDDTSGYWSGLSCASASRDAKAGMDTLTSFPDPCSITVKARGAVITVYGTSDGLSAVNFTVDGAVLDTFGDAGSATIAALSSIPVDDGWHTVTLDALDGAGIQLDGVEFASAGALLRSSGDTAGTEGDADTDTDSDTDTDADADADSDTGSGPEDSDTTGADSDPATPDGCDCASASPAGGLGPGLLLGLATLRRRPRRP